MVDNDAVDLERILRRRGHDVRVGVDPNEPDHLQVRIQSRWPLWLGWLKWILGR